MFQHGLNTLYIDLDGTLADFEGLGNVILGMHTREYEGLYGSAMFYARLRAYGTFFLDLEPFPGAIEFWDSIRHLNPVILSGIPWQIPEATVQKVDWVRKHLGPDTKIITPRSKDKNLYCVRNDVIVDDWPQHKARWIEKGGIWVDHRNYEESTNALRQLEVLK